MLTSSKSASSWLSIIIYTREVKPCYADDRIDILGESGGAGNRPLREGCRNAVFFVYRQWLMGGDVKLCHADDRVDILGESGRVGNRPLRRRLQECSLFSYEFSPP